MTLNDLLKSLTDAERDFIAQLDYGQNQILHRRGFDQAIENGGIIDFEVQGDWYPYEVIELGKNWLQFGHEREYASCMGIVLKNMLAGRDQTNEIEHIIENQYETVSKLPLELKDMLDEIFQKLIEIKSNCQPGKWTPTAQRNRAV